MQNNDPRVEVVAQYMEHQRRYRSEAANIFAREILAIVDGATPRPPPGEFVVTEEMLDRGTHAAEPDIRHWTPTGRQMMETYLTRAYPVMAILDPRNRAVEPVAGDAVEAALLAAGCSSEAMTREEMSRAISAADRVRGRAYVTWRRPEDYTQGDGGDIIARFRTHPPDGPDYEFTLSISRLNALQDDVIAWAEMPAPPPWATVARTAMELFPGCKEFDFKTRQSICWEGGVCLYHNCEHYDGDKLKAAMQRDAEAASDERAPAPPPPDFQSGVHHWLLACFGPEIAADKTERNHRFLEESLELVQSAGCTMSEAHQLVDYVFNRPIGEIEQEVGGVMNTLAALCLAHGLDMMAAGEKEMARVWTKVEQIRAKQAAKPKYSPLPGPSPHETPGAAVLAGGETYRPPTWPDGCTHPGGCRYYGAGNTCAGAPGCPHIGFDLGLSDHAQGILADSVHVTERLKQYGIWPDQLRAWIEGERPVWTEGKEALLKTLAGSTFGLSPEWDALLERRLRSAFPEAAAPVWPEGCLDSHNRCVPAGKCQRHMLGCPHAKRGEAGNG